MNSNLPAVMKMLNSHMKMKIITRVFIVLLLTFMTSCRKSSETHKVVISVKGSDTMVNLSQRWASAYMQKNPEVSLQVTGGGSGTGFAALLNRTTDIANASRELKPMEIERARAVGIVPRQYKVALDGIAVIVHVDNPLDSLAVSQLSKIFTGEIKNWMNVGGDDREITLYGRENSSGTYEYFKNNVLNADNSDGIIDYASSMQVLQGTAALGEAVARDEKGIGFGGVGYFSKRKDVKIIAVKADEHSKAILPAENGRLNLDAVWNGSYPIARHLYCFTDSLTEHKSVGFLKFILSGEGQRLVETMEYIPLPEKHEVLSASH